MSIRTSSLLVSQKSARSSLSSSGVNRSEEKMVVGVTADCSSVVGWRLRRRVFIAILFPTARGLSQPEATTRLRSVGAVQTTQPRRGDGPATSGAPLPAVRRLAASGAWIGPSKQEKSAVAARTAARQVLPRPGGRTLLVAA